ncbi:MAG: anthranilate synthase component I [Eubacteriales bacterium]
MIYPSYDKFAALTKTARVIPVIQKINADLYTPISVFQKFGCRPDSFLLESVVGGDRWARYSIMGRNPILSFCVSAGKTTYKKLGQEYPSDLLGRTPLTQLSELLRQCESEHFSYINHFYCGLLGYFGYDFIRYCEVLPDNNPDTIGLPDCNLSAPGEVIVFDHLKNEISVIVNVFSEGGVDLYEKAASRLSEIITEIQSPVPAELSRIHPEDLNFVPQTSMEDFCTSVEKAKAYIRDGDIFQVVLSQRFTADYQGDPLPVYRALRSVNPSPYMFYIQLEDSSIVGSSPEMLVRVTDGRIETCPIAGTRPRGKNEAEDRRLTAELLADEKEISEHYMLVDLARNDVGKVAAFGTVEVKNMGHVEKYSHVMHIVTNVEGTLREGLSTIDVLSSLLPAGTLSGAPKVRAMEIIDELEPLRRGIYGGAVGYLGFDKNMDTCIAIRSAVIRKGKIHVQAGAGIVADSVPETEYLESMNKAKALFVALEKAGGMR